MKVSDLSQPYPFHVSLRDPLGAAAPGESAIDDTQDPGEGFLNASKASARYPFSAFFVNDLELLALVE